MRSWVLVVSCLLLSQFAFGDWKSEALENLKSPVQYEEPKQVLWVGGGASLILVLFRSEIVDPFQVEMTTKKPLGSLSPLGDYSGQGIPNALYAGAMLADYYTNDDESSFDHASNMFQATLYSVGTTALLKATFRQPRPNDPKTLTSFPSGHTTSGFAFASYVGCAHSLWAGVGAYSLATLVGLSRINDNAHYLHDVVAGGAIGTAFGLGVCYASRERKAQPLTPQMSVVPTEEGGVMSFHWQF